MESTLGAESSASFNFVSLAEFGLTSLSQLGAGMIL